MLRMGLPPTSTMPTLYSHPAHHAHPASICTQVTTCANLGVVASLLIAATHQTTVGRPKPMEASAAFEEEFGQRASLSLLWATYAGNTCTG